MARGAFSAVLLGPVAGFVFVLSCALAPAADDPAKEAAIEGLVRRASSLYLPPVQRLPWQEFQDRTSLPYQQEQEEYLRKVKEVPDTPDRDAIISRISYEFADACSTKYLLLGKQAIAARNFTYARNYLGHLYIPDGYWSAEKKQLVKEEKFLQRKCEGLKLYYGAYIDAHEYVMDRVDGVAKRLAQRRWSCPGWSGKKTMVGVWIDYADPRSLLSEYERKRLAEWRTYHDQFASTAGWKRERDLPHDPTWYLHLNLSWVVSRDPHKHYPEKGYFGVSISGLYHGGSASEYIKTHLRSITPEHYPHIEVTSGRNWALFMDTKLVQAKLLLIRTPKGYLYIGIHNHLPSGLDDDGERQVSREMLNLAADELVKALAGDIPGEEQDETPLDVPPQLAVRAIDPATGNPVEFLELKPKGSKFDHCRIEVAFRDGDDQPIAGAKILFPKPPIGGLSAQEVTTGADGKAAVEYTAPSEEELKKQGKLVFEQYLAVTEAKTGLKGDIVITTRSDEKSVVAELAYPIVPAHRSYGDVIRLRFNVAARPDGQPHRAVAYVKNESGSLTCDFQIERPKVEWDVEPETTYTLVYRWLGPAELEKPEPEIVTIELPQLKLRESVELSVGVDLGIKEVRRRGGPMTLPLMHEALDVVVEDAFHKDAALDKLFSAYDLQPSVTIDLLSFQAAQVSPAENGLISSILSHFDVPGGVESCYPWSLPVGTAKRSATHADEWIMIDKHWKNKQQKGYPPDYVFPGVQLMNRGNYTFDVALGFGLHDAGNKNNSKEVDFVVTEYQTYELQSFRTVQLPCIETLIRGAVSLAGGIEKLPGLVKLSAQVDTTLGITDVGIALKEGRKKDAVLGCVGLYAGAAGAMPGVSDAGKSLAEITSVTLYAHEAIQRSWEATVAPAERTVSETGQQVRTTSGDGLAEGLEFTQLLLQGFGNQSLVCLERPTLTTFEAFLADGTPITPIPPKLFGGDIGRGQRMRTSDRFVVIGLQRDEAVLLRLSGSSGTGRLITVTPKAIEALQYPSGDWKAEIRVDGSGKAVFANRKLVDWQRDTSVLPGGEVPGPAQPDTTPPSADVAPPGTPSDKPRPGPSPGPRPSADGFAGAWRTNFGTLRLTIDGHKVTGTFGDSGRVTGELSADGKQLSGRWSEGPTHRPPDAGRFILTLSADGKAFDGRFSYGDKDPQMPWKGTQLR